MPVNPLERLDEVRHWLETGLRFSRVEGQGVTRIPDGYVEDLLAILRRAKDIAVIGAGMGAPIGSDLAGEAECVLCAAHNGDLNAPSSHDPACPWRALIELCDPRHERSATPVK